MHQRDQGPIETARGTVLGTLGSTVEPLAVFGSVPLNIVGVSGALAARVNVPAAPLRGQSCTALTKHRPLTVSPLRGGPSAAKEVRPCDLRSFRSTLPDGQLVTALTALPVREPQPEIPLAPQMLAGLPTPLAALDAGGRSMSRDPAAIP